MMVFTKFFKKFFKSSESSGLLLMAAVAVSLLIANSSAADILQKILHFSFGPEFLHLKLSAQDWINDGLMAVFFMLAGLEIKRELAGGELSDFRRAALPIFAAVGGMLIPAIIYTLLNHGTPYGKGWGIPMATDIAFSLAVISLIGGRVPTSIKIFLTALAIADDLGAIAVIAIFYTEKINLTYLGLSSAVFLLLIAFNYLKIKKLTFYLLPGLALWYFLHHSGIHATIAGVLTAFCIPEKTQGTESPLETLEERLHFPVNYLIMPLFALANTNITLHRAMVDGLFSHFGAGILMGLALGKPLGIAIFSWFGVKAGFCSLPEKSTWMQMVGTGFLAGIGFTMSIFIAMICFKNPEIQDEAKFAVLVASAGAGFIGYLILKYRPGKVKPHAN